MKINPDLLYDSGTNYIKYEDGTAIVWGSVRLNCGTSKTTYYSTVNLPITFKDNTYIVNIMPSNPWAYYTGLFPCAGTRTTTTCQIGGWYDSAISTGGNLDYIIIGKWK